MSEASHRRGYAKARWIYDDSMVACGHDGLLIRNFYFPSGRSRKIPWTAIRSVQRRKLRFFSGKLRIWGMDVMPIWYHLDWKRLLKKEAIVIDAGGVMKIGITPRDLDKVLAIIRQRTGY